MCIFYLKVFLFFYFFKISHSDLFSPEDKCVHVRQCPHLYELIKTKKFNFGTTTILNLLKCTNKIRESKVYCIDPEKVNSFVEKADTLNEKKCGINPPTDKISGGSVAAIDEYPWIALLKYKTKNNSIDYGCHANLINKKYLLTAAHCLDLSSPSDFVELYSVVLAEYDTRTQTDCVGGDCINSTIEKMVESYYLHPQYDKTLRKNDIALIRLKTEVEYTDFIKPICLPPSIFFPFYEEILFIAGWGLDDTNEMNPVKNKAKFQIKKAKNCVANFTNEQYCASSMEIARTCRGDSGGPLMAIRFNDQSRYHLIGVTSLGSRCDILNKKVSIYTKISSHIEWIVTTIEK